MQKDESGKALVLSSGPEPLFQTIPKNRMRQNISPLSFQQPPDSTLFFKVLFYKAFSALGNFSLHFRTFYFVNYIQILGCLPEAFSPFKAQIQKTSFAKQQLFFATPSSLPIQRAQTADLIAFKGRCTLLLPIYAVADICSNRCKVSVLVTFLLL